ncbi:zf-HC2 domain-containing protein [bacterium]|nr:zf-HC2 domain-containing protein [bacterium]
MNCTQAQDLLIEWLRGELPQETEHALELHCQSCTACASERDQLQHAWTALTDWPNEDPSQAAKPRFNAMLSAYQSGMDAANERRSLLDRLDQLLAHLWPQRPIWQAGLVMSALVLGLVLGGRSTQSNQLETLEKQVDAMQQMVALTLQTAQSSSQRLEALSLVSRVKSPKDVLIQSLLTALKEDPSTNVRLASIDALARFVDREEICNNLNGSFDSQPSPLVQTALINLFAQSGYKYPLERIAGENTLDPVVRAHAQHKLDAMI